MSGIGGIGGIGGTQAFARMQEVQQMQGNAQAHQTQMQQVQQVTDQQRVEAAKASGSKVGTVINTMAWWIFTNLENRFFWNDFFFEKKLNRL